MHSTFHRTVWLFLPILCMGCSGDAGTNPRCDEAPACYDDSFGHLGFMSTDDEAAWSPDGRTIAYWHGGPNYGIYFVSPQATDNHLFMAGTGQLPDWSPDGKWLVLANGGRLYRVSASGDSLAEIPALPSEKWYPDWSPDGSRIVYNCPAGDNAGIWVVPSDSDHSSLSRRLCAAGLYPDWSHSGREIVFLGQVGEDCGICVMDSSGADPRLVFGGDYSEHDIRYPTFSPDDREILFSWAQPGRVPQVWVVNADGGNARQLTICGGIYPAWSPDGQYIAYTDTRRCNGRLWIMKTDGSCRRQITCAEWW